MFQYTERELLIPFHHPLSFYPPQPPTPAANGISATLIEPAFKSDLDDTTGDGGIRKRRQNRVVILLHGQDTSKSYGYIPVLARSLAQTHGLFALAFDFRSHGESQDADHAQEKGHLRQSEWADLGIVVGFAKRHLGLDVAAFVGHSRGSVAMMEWALLQQLNSDGEGVYVPALVNCSGRYSSGEFIQLQYMLNPEWLTSPPFATSRQRFGKWVDLTTPQSELISMASSDTDLVKYLRPDTAVLTVHGDADVMVSVDDAYKWDRQLGQVPGRHTLKILEGANHNFRLEDEDSKYFIKDPENGQKKVRPTAIRYIANMVTDFLSVENENKRFHSRTEFMPFTNNTVPRFKNIKNVVNFRDFGGFLSTVRNTATAAGTVQWVKPGILFRSGKLDHAPPQTTALIASEFNIKHVFDLRTAVELKPTKHTTPQGLVNIPGAVTHHVPIFEDESYAPQDLVNRMHATGGDTSVLHDTNLDILHHGIRSRVFLNLFLCLRDPANTPILVHCSAGKDRTGVFCALLLLLLGVDPNTVAHEYELTTHGYAPERNKIIEAMRRGRTAKTAYQGMSVQGWEALLSSQFETMLELIGALDREYGGVMGYLYNGVGLTPDDVARIRENLLYDGELVPVHRVWDPKL